MYAVNKFSLRFFFLQNADIGMNFVLNCINSDEYEAMLYEYIVIMVNKKFKYMNR